MMEADGKAQNGDQDRFSPSSPEHSAATTTTCFPNADGCKEVKAKAK